ncbi:MAG: restriction endonuclease subunit S [Sandaracinaceae bacterium]|nr:restriction endonuclease subunit S [Sandaracinaceae bacterium]
MRNARLSAGWLKPDGHADDWRIVQIGDVSKTVAGGRLGLTKELHYQASGIPAFSAAGQDGFVMRVEFAATDAVVLSSVGANCGKCFLAEGSWTTLANVQAIVTDPTISARFLYYRVNRDGYWPRSGSAQPFIKPSDIGRCWIQLPPLAEQRRIAEILDTVDEAIRKTEEIIAKLKLVKQGMLHDLLTRGIDDNGELRDPDRNPEQFKDSPLGRIPSDWELRRLEDCVRSDAAITYGIVQAGPHVPDGVPYIRTGDMSGTRLSANGLLRTSARIASSYARSRVVASDIVCAIRATVGKVLLVPAELEGANLTQGTARIAPAATISPTFLLWSLRGASLQRQFDQSVKGTTFREITLAQLRVLRVAMPITKHEQDHIAAMFESLEERGRCEEATANKLRLMKRGLMDDLLTGRVRVTELLNEAAE